MIRRAVYEITLRGTPPAGLTARFPSMTLQFLALALSACSGGESANPSASTSASVIQVAVTPSTQSPGTSGAPSPASGNTATCKDSPSDAQIDAGELRQVDLQHQGDELKATFKLAHSIPQTGTFGTYLGVSNADGSKARQLGVKWLDGKLMSYFVFDVGKGPQQNLEGEPVVDNKTVIALFPWDAVSDLGAAHAHGHAHEGDVFLRRVTAEPVIWYGARTVSSAGSVSFAE